MSNDLGRLIRHRRKELGLTQSDLTARMSAAGVTVDRSTISHLEGGRIQTPAPNVLNALAQALEVAPLVLLVESDYHLPGVDAQAEQLMATFALLDDTRRRELLFVAQAILRAQQSEQDVP